MNASGNAPILCLMGPTAAGKSAATLALARRWPIEIVNVDSATIYRGMDIGTAKLPVDARRGHRRPQGMMMHLREGHKQQVHRIQHQLDTHKDDNRIPARQHPGHPDTKQRHR